MKIEELEEIRTYVGAAVCSKEIAFNMLNDLQNMSSRLLAEVDRMHLTLSHIADPAYGVTMLGDQRESLSAGELRELAREALN